MTGDFLLINKSSRPTSHDVIDGLRRITKIKKIGHVGTLDPFASGLLIVGVGRESTRRLGEFLKLDKIYVVTLRLGAVSDTHDRIGHIKTQEQKNIKTIEEDGIKKILKQFKGEIEQVPPMYSAKKIKGKRLYELARQGVEIERQPVKVIIYELGIRNYEWPELIINCKIHQWKMITKQC